MSQMEKVDTMKVKKIGPGSYETEQGHQIKKTRGGWCITYPGAKTPDVARPTLREAREYLALEAAQATPSADQDDTTSGALRLTADEIKTAAPADAYEHPWWVVAERLRNGHIDPDSYMSCMHGPRPGIIACLSHDTRAAAVAQVRSNLPYYTSGWVVTTEGAERIFDLPELIGETYPSGYDGRRRLYTADILPFDALPAYRYGGPSKIATGAYAVSTTSGTDIDGYRLNIRKLPVGDAPSEDHPLHGTVYPTRDDADRAAYEAGATAFWVKETDRIMYGLH